jgi:hypothetical protein
MMTISYVSLTGNHTYSGNVWFQLFLDYTWIWYNVTLDYNIMATRRVFVSSLSLPTPFTPKHHFPLSSPIL